MNNINFDMYFICRRIFYSDEDSDTEENWKMLTSTRKTHTAANRNQIPDTRERISLLNDISLLKKQYSKIRERQRQANLTNTTTKQPVNSTISNTKPSNINQYLIGRNAIVSNKKRHGPPAGSIPPARTALPMSATNKYQQKRLRNATIDNASTSAMKIRSDDNSNVQKKKAFARKRSESSSYSEDSDKGSEDELDNCISVESSSSSTSLCDDDFGNASSMDGSPMKSQLHSSASDDSKSSLPKDLIGDDFDQSSHTRLEAIECDDKKSVKRDSSQESDTEKYEILTNIDRENNDIHFASIGGGGDDKPEKTNLDLLSLPQREQITSTSQLSPIADILNILSTSTISPLKTPTSYLLHSYPLCELSGTEENQEDRSDIDFSINTGSSDKDFFKVSEEGVTNAYFERVNHVTTLNMDSKFPFSFIEDTPDTNLESRLSRSSQEDIDEEESSTFKSEVRRLSDSFESAIISIDQADTDATKSSSNSNTNSDAILKMIEENSKILDRIMCKNAQATARKITSLDDNENSKSDSKYQAKSESKSECNINSKYETKSDFNCKMNQSKKPIADSLAENNEYPHIPKVKITSEDDDCLIEKEQKDEIISLTQKIKSYDDKIETKTDDDHVFKYGDLSDCISKYLINTNEKSEKRVQSEHESIKSETNEKLPKAESLDLPKTLSLLTHDEGSTEDIRNLLKESLFDYSRSPSESLPVDSKLENDLETLLKLSAELLREGFPLGSPTDEPGQNWSVEGDDLTEACVIDTNLQVLEVENDESSESNRNSMYLDPDALQLEMESVAGDISATISSIKNTIQSIDSLCQDDDRRPRERTDKALSSDTTLNETILDDSNLNDTTISSIKNTIKSIDSLCQDDDRRSRERTDKTLNDIIKVVEKLDEEKDSRKSSETRESDSTMTSVILSSVLEHKSRNESNFHGSNTESPRMATSSRISRDRSRMTSPRRRKDDDFGEYESRARRNKSPSSSILSQNRYSADFSNKFKLEEFSSGSDKGSKSKIGSLYKTNEKLEIRHTTVTLTAYDRFLSQKYEQQHKMDRSPSSPVINKAYLNSLKATSSMTSSYHSGSDKYRRDSRSTSPIISSSSHSHSRFDSSRYMPSAPKSGYLHLPQLSVSSRDQCTRSCENILSNLNSTSEFAQKYSYRMKTTPSDIFSSTSIDSDKILKRHSTGTYYQNSSALPIKPKKPSEIGIKLGLYKPE